MSNFPQTREGMEAAGYRLVLRRKCALCPATIEFYETAIKKWLPMEWLEAERRLVPHWATCPHAEDFRGPKHEAAYREVPHLSKKQQKRRDMEEKKKKSESGRLFE